MKVILNKLPLGADESAVINASDITDSVCAAISLLEDGERLIKGFKDGEQFPVKVSSVYYAEAVDKRCFVYTKNDCYEVRSRLYELETSFDSRFLRISKSMICNIRKIRSVKSEANSRLIATLLNGETIVITRSYVKDLKRRLGL